MAKSPLLGQHIGSLRMVRFTGAANRNGLSEELLEIETKAGRFFHFRPDSQAKTISLESGPAIPETATAAIQEHPGVFRESVRSSRDLSEFLSGAFDGRPVVEAVEPAFPAESDSGHPLPTSQGRSAAGAPPPSGTAPAEMARGWRLRLSTGYVITFSWEQGLLHLAGGYSGDEPYPTSGAER